MDDSAATVKNRHDPGRRWLLLIHQIPPKPDYFRIKVRRRLQRIGAVALKNSVYLLPARSETLEDFRWLRREIEADGGEATVCEADLVEGMTSRELETMFTTARDSDYAEIVSAVESSQQIEPELGRLRLRLEEIASIDYFGASGRVAAERALTAAEARLRRPAHQRKGLERMRGHTWVTRSDVFIDRIASAWLIRRFIDPKATFKFTNSRSYRASAGEVRFDMYEAEYTHQGDRCTFETLLEQSGLRDRALRAIGEIVHDIDCKDGKFGREEAPGVAALLRGLVRAHPDDADRLERGAELFDQLYAALRSSPR